MQNKPRIILDCEKLKNPYSGLGQFCFHLGNALVEEGVPNLTMYAPAASQTMFGDKVDFLKQKSLHKLFGVPTLPDDIFHATHQTSKYEPSNKQTKYLLTVHDLNFLYKYSGTKLSSKLKSLQQKIYRASVVTAISHFASQEIQKHMELKGKQVHVIHNGNTLNASVSPQKPSWLTNNRPFLFTIGIILPRKNFHTLIPMMKKLKDFQLIIAGDANSEYGKRIFDEVKKSGMDESILMPGKISDQEKLWLYQHCSGFLFPSVAEGFGLPVVEAMSLGKPVFVNNATSLPEIAGPNGFYWNNFDPDEMALVVEKGLATYHSDNLSEKYKAHAAQFSWKNAAKQYAQLYDQLLKK